LAGKVLHSGETVAEDGAKDFEGALKDATKAVENMSPSQVGHTALDILGMVPVVGTVANLANAGWYAVDGDWKDAAWSAVAAIPIEGDVADAAKLGKDGIEIAEDATKVGEDGATIAGDAAEATARGEPATPPQPGSGAPPREPPDGGTPPQTGQPEPPERPEDSEPYSRQKTPHGQQRADEARAGDTHRQVGDPNRVAQEGRVFTDSETGNTIHVKGNRVVITDSKGEIVSQFRITRANIQKQILSGKWTPEPRG
jgi:hypothetical protein